MSVSLPLLPLPLLLPCGGGPAGLGGAPSTGVALPLGGLGAEGFWGIIYALRGGKRRACAPTVPDVG